MPPINGDYQNLDLNKAPIRLGEPEKLESSNIRTIKKSRARRNRQIRNLRSLIQSFFVQYLFTAAPGEIRTDPPRRKGERSWSPQPPAPPNSPAPEEVPQNVNIPRELPYSPSRPSINDNATESEPDSEQFRPTTPSYSPDISIHSPGAAPRACSSPIPSPIPHPGDPEKVDFFADDDTVFWQESDGPGTSPSPAPSVEFLGEQEKPRAIVDPLLELLRRTFSPWTDPVPERAFTIGPDSFDPEEIRRETSRASPDQNILIFYPGVEHPFLAPIRLIDRVFPRSSAKISEIIEIELD
ncbi:hypothetical protein PUN28_020780 [Cardiocondyla obscurior]|uniref:Uncharacterized protein n=1 Tax=Cardiocondyla obscurior TaxID=286306 RepID=A0AAW2E9B2_9HYME